MVAAATVFALVQRSNAEDKERDARARRLDASAVALLQSDPELGLLLASESARMSPGAAAEDALRQSLLASHAAESSARAVRSARSLLAGRAASRVRQRERLGRGP